MNKLKNQDMIFVFKNESLKKSFMRRKSKLNFLLSKEFSSVFFILDKIIYKLRIYNRIFNLFSEIVQNIFNENIRYAKEFGHSHKFIKLNERIKEEMKESFLIK
tara:strand:- start:1114 stop:1425 length:312 start_codon:yes stop_codon:yes gene_type:complete